VRSPIRSTATWSGNVALVLRTRSAGERRYVDIPSNTEDGRMLLDYGKFHDVTPEES